MSTQLIASNLHHPADDAGGYALVRHETTGIYSMSDGAALRSVDQAWARSLHFGLLDAAAGGPSPRKIAAHMTGQGYPVSPRTVESWQQRRRSPPGEAVRLMELLAKGAK